MIPQMSLLIAALIQVESGGNDAAIGDNGTAYGCLQITQAVVTDCNRVQGTVRYELKDALNRHRAITMFLMYVTLYASSEQLGHEPTLEEIARVWNGGPAGYRKPSTLPYWRKVEAELRRMSERPLAASTGGAHHD